MPYLRFEPEAQEIFRDWRKKLEAKLRAGDLHPAQESHFSKYRKLIPALALSCHLADGGMGNVSKIALLRALAWGEYLESHANRAYASVSTPEVASAKAIIYRIGKGDLPANFSSRDVWRPGWTNLTDKNKVHDALALLIDYDWLGVTKIGTAGRDKTIYTVNPRVLL